MGKQQVVRTGAICATILAAAVLIGRAGPVNPPAGPVVDTGQFGTRTPISSLPFAINQPGSYFLTGVLTGGAGLDGITIDADDVTLDLNGFTLMGVAGSLDGVRVNGVQRNIEIKNGSVRGWGGDAIDAGSAVNSVIEDVRMSDCVGVGLSFGTRNRVSRCTALDCIIGVISGSYSIISECSASGSVGQGILTGTGCTVSSCTAEGNGLSGIEVSTGSTLRDCAARNNTQDGIKTGLATSVIGCTASENGDDGFDLGSKSRMVNCNAYFNGDDGIALGSNSSARRCTSTTNGSDGIFAASECTVVDNDCSDNGFSGTGAGVRVSGFGIRVESNNVNSNQTGLQSVNPNNYFADNTVQANADNYDFVGGNQLNLLLGELPEQIDWPASVKLAGTLFGVSGQNGLQLNALGVTVDLDGHSLIGVPGSVSGIQANANDLAAIRNGVVRDWGDVGVSISGASASTLHDLRVANNGAGGMILSNFVVVNQCTTYQNGGAGMLGGGAVVSECTAGENGGTGINAGAGVVTHCLVRDNAGSGITASPGLAHANSAWAVQGQFPVVVGGTGTKAHNNEQVNQ